MKQFTDDDLKQLKELPHYDQYHRRVLSDEILKALIFRLELGEVVISMFVDLKNKNVVWYDEEAQEAVMKWCKAAGK